MGYAVQGIPASPGIVSGRARVVRWPVLSVSHATVEADRVEAEVERLREACRRAQERTHALRADAEGRLGSVPAKIFDPQLLMLEDPDLIGGAITYIRDSYLTAERAFDLRVLEFRSQWLDATHARVMDRVADLTDVQARVLSALTAAPAPDDLLDLPEGPVVLVAADVTPSRIVALDTERVLGIATDAGTRTSHSSILARSLGLPAVVGLTDLSAHVEDGTELILDGHRGRVIVDPDQSEKRWFHDREVQVRELQEELGDLAPVEPVSGDGVRITLYANLELPSDASYALAAGADGIGLFRTEFLVVGKSTVPDEAEQYEAFRDVVELVAPRPVVIRTYDLGGDKFPMFMPPLAEENPFLGWRGVRVYRKMPDLFRNQVRAIMRAAARGDVRILLPLVTSVDEVLEVRSVLDAVREELEREGVEHGAPPLGVMLETPAAIAIADVLGRYVDFFSLGTNDLAQYALAVDRGNAQLARFYDPFHPALIRFIRDAVEAAERTGRELSACGEATADALGSFLLMGLGVRTLSCPPGSVPELKKLIRSIRLEEAERAAESLFSADTGSEVRRRLLESLQGAVDIDSLGSTASLSRPE